MRWRKREAVPRVKCRPFIESQLQCVRQLRLLRCKDIMEVTAAIVAVLEESVFPVRVNHFCK